MYYKVKVIFLFFNTLSIIYGSTRIQTNYGDVEGFNYEDPEGNEYGIFLGIPYAKPPLEELRFEKPLPPDKWNDVKETKQYSSDCIQLTRSDIKNEISEDCLKLNIITLKESKNNVNGYPVLFIVHDGEYGIGSSSFFCYKILARNFASQNIVVVTINYRLGAFGFGSLDKNEMPGNYGLWDQRMALIFIKENIKFFGGNPSKIVVMGLGSGAGCVGALSLSPHTNKYIYKAIQISGSIFNGLSSVNNILTNETLNLASSLNCTTENINFKEIKECLKSKYINEVINGVEKLGKKMNNIYMAKFGPSYDNDFFPDNYDNLILQSKIKIPTFIGSTNLETLNYVLMNDFPSINSIYINYKQYSRFQEKDLYEFIRRYFTSKHHHFDVDKKIIEKKIVNFYKDLVISERRNNTDNLYLICLIRLTSDILINIPVLWEGEAKSKAGWPVYMYKNIFYNSKMFPNDIPIKGSTHGIENYYIFYNKKQRKFKKSIKDVKFAVRYLKTLIYFITDKSLFIGKRKIPKYIRTGEYLEFSTDIKIKQHLYKKNSEFWKDYRSEYHYDLIRNVPYTKEW